MVLFSAFSDQISLSESFVDGLTDLYILEREKKLSFQLNEMFSLFFWRIK